MARSQYAENVDLIQTQVTGALRPEGFRKRARTYNRATEDGLVHVVNLQMGPYELGAEIPGLRKNLWGLFTVNLGVYVPELDPVPRDAPRRQVPEYMCSIRTRFGPIIGMEEDLWWPAGETWPDSAAEVVRCLVEYGLPFLERYDTRESIAEHWIEDAERLRLSNVARLDVARILIARGDKSKAAQLVQQQYDRSSHLPGHQEVVARMAKEAGIGLKVGDA